VPPQSQFTTDRSSDEGSVSRSRVLCPQPRQLDTAFNLIMAKCASPPPDAIPQPTTPGRVHDLAAGVKLQSTPSNRGSASTAEYDLASAREAQTFALHTILTKPIFVHSEDDVSPSILADIQNHNTCTVETLLNGLLSLCLPEDHYCNTIHPSVFWTNVLRPSFPFAILRIIGNKRKGRI